MICNCPAVGQHCRSSDPSLNAAHEKFAVPQITKFIGVLITGQLGKSSQCLYKAAAYATRCLFDRLLRPWTWRFAVRCTERARVKSVTSRRRKHVVLRWQRPPEACISHYQETCVTHGMTSSIAQRTRSRWWSRRAARPPSSGLSLGTRCQWTTWRACWRTRPRSTPR